MSNKVKDIDIKTGHTTFLMILSILLVSDLRSEAKGSQFESSC